jgi:hypothetical protein
MNSVHILSYFLLYQRVESIYLGIIGRVLMLSIQEQVLTHIELKYQSVLIVKHGRKLA